MKPVEATWEGRGMRRGGTLSHLSSWNLLHTILDAANRLDIQLRNVCLIFRAYGWLQSLWTPWTPFAPWSPWNIQLSQGTGQGVSMTFNAASRLPSLEDRSAALGSSRCELPGMHSLPKSAVLPYASGVGGLSRRLLNTDRQTKWQTDRQTDRQTNIHTDIRTIARIHTCIHA